MSYNEPEPRLFGGDGWGRRPPPGLKSFLFTLNPHADPELRDHFEVKDQVREVLIHASYMSLMDLGFCAQFDLAELAGHQHFEEIAALLAEVQAWVASEDALAA